MTWAKDSLEDPVDVFVIYTCQTGQGKAKTPVEAIREYRDKMKHPAARYDEIFQKFGIFW